MTTDAHTQAHTQADVQVIALLEVEQNHLL